MESLKINSTGKLVTYLQRKLIALNYSVTVNENFGQDLEEAVRDFQTKNELVVDGIVGGNTWTRIYALTEHHRDASARIERHDDIMQLHPKVRKAVVQVYVQLQSEGIPFRIYEAFRYPERQADLYAQGRTKPGPVVTYAKPWSSYHQYGLATDFVLFTNGNWSWDDKGNNSDLWKRLHQLGAEEGLMRLEFEVPHLQVTGTSSNALKEGVYPSGGDKSWYDNMLVALGKQNS